MLPTATRSRSSGSLAVQPNAYAPRKVSRGLKAEAARKVAGKRLTLHAIIPGSARGDESQQGGASEGGQIGHPLLRSQPRCSTTVLRHGLSVQQRLLQR